MVRFFLIRLMHNRLLFLKLFITLFLFTLSSTTLFGQKQFTVFNYTSKNGLAQNSVKSAILDDDGFLWMTSESGLVRFDGRNFKVFNSTGYPSLKTDRVTFIYKTYDNGLYFFNEFHNCYHILSNEISPLSASGNEQPFNYMPANFPDTSLYSKFLFQGIQIQMNDNWSGSYLSVFPLAQKRFGVATSTGINFYTDTLKTGSLRTDAYKVSEYFMIGNTIYFLDKKLNAFKIDDSNLRIIPCRFNNLFSINNPELFWKYGRPGAYVRDDQKLYRIKESGNENELQMEFLFDDMPQNCKVNTLFYDDNNLALFIGTDTKGLFVCKEKIISTFTFIQFKTNSNNAYYSQFALDSQTVVTNKGFVFNQHGFVTDRFPVSFNMEGVLRDSNDNIWLNEKGYIIKYNLNNHHKTLIKGSLKKYAYCFYELHDTVWVGTTNCIGYVVNDSLIVATGAIFNGTFSAPVCMTSVTGNYIWFCNGQGVFRLNTKSFEIDTIKALNNKKVRTIAVHNGYVFIGTYGNGYYLFKDNKTVKIPADRNNYLSKVHAFIFDRNGYVWMTSNQGLFKTNFEDLIKYFNDSTNQIFYRYYAEEEGIDNSEFNGGCSPPYVYLTNGYVSLPTMNGLVWFKPDDVKDIESKMPVLVDAVYLDDSLLNVKSNQNISIPPSIRTVRFNFTTSFWGNSNNLLIEYKLLGYAPEWIVVNPDHNSIEFSNLPSGNYTLLLRKKIGFAPEQFVVTHVTISVGKKFYEQTWFLIICGILATLFVTVVARLYARNIKKNNKALEEKIRMRTIELQSANLQLKQSVGVKDKLISIISHDIVTPLRFIAMVARKGSEASTGFEKENMRDVLTEIKSTSEKLRDNAQNILNWIKHQNNRITVNKTHIAVSALADELADMLKEMADAKGTQIVNNISHDDIFKTDKNILSIILHNLLTNAIKFTTNGSVIIDAEFDNAATYNIIVSDTGTGIDNFQLERIQKILAGETAHATNPSAPGNGNGLGFIIISELLQLISGKIFISHNVPKGTSIKIILAAN